MTVVFVLIFRLIKIKAVSKVFVLNDDCKAGWI